MARLGRVPRVAAVGVAAALGGGVLFLPGSVSTTSGPVAPLVFVAAGVVAGVVAVPFAVFASSPLVGRDGGVYAFVSRTWGTPVAGLLAGWPVVGAYVALLALVGAWLGRLGPLPPGGAAYASGDPVARSPVAVALGVDAVPDVAAAVLSVVVLAVAAGVHLRDDGSAMRVVSVLAWGVVASLSALLLAAFVPGVGEFVPTNYADIYPTETLRENPVGSFFAGVVTAAFVFVGVDATVTVGADESVADPDRTLPRALGLATATLGALSALASLVALGVVPWVRLNLADVPTADAIAAYLPVPPGPLTVVVSLVAGVGALFALGFPAARTLAGIAEVTGRDAAERRRRAVIAVYGTAAFVVAVDALAVAVGAAVAGIAVGALGVAVSAAALPWVRPSLAERCRLPAGPLAVVSVVAAVVAVGMLSVTLARDPATVMGYTLRRVSLSVFEFELVRDPVRSVVPVLVAWESVGLVGYLVARDYARTSGTLGGDRKPDTGESPPEE